MQISWSASHLLLGIAPEEQPPDHYRLLGLGRLELNADVIVYAAERQSDHLKRYFAGEHRETASALHDAVSAARDCLLDHDSHQIYAGRVQGFDPDSDDLDAKSAWRAFADEFEDAWNRSQALGFDAQHYWLGIPRHQRPASNSRLLGLNEGEQDPEVVQCAAERQISFVRKFASGDKSAEANTLLQQLSRARSTLLRTCASSGPNRDPEPEYADPLDEPIEILPLAPDPEVELLDDSYASDPDWGGSDIIDQPVHHAYMASTQAPAAENSPAVLVRQPSRKGPARFTLRAMAFALLILSSHAAIGFFGYRFLLADPQSEPVAEVAEVETRLGAGRLERTESGRIQSTREQPQGIRSGPSVADLQRESARRAQFAAALARANHADPSKIDSAQLDLAEALASSSGEEGAIRAVRNRVAQWEISLQRNDTRSFLTQLSLLDRRVDQIQQRAEAGSSVAADAQEVLDLVETISKLGGTFPSHSDEAADQATRLSQLAGELLSRITSVDRGEMIEPGGMNEEPATPSLEPTEASEEPQYANSRTWTTTTGLSFEASVSKLGRDHVVLQRTADGREGKFQIDDLVIDDRRTAIVSCFNEQDEEQLQGSQDYVDQIASTPKDASDPLKEHHISFQDSPYGGLWAAVCLSELLGNLISTDRAESSRLPMSNRCESVAQTIPVSVTS
jgi:hypothetical protein